MRVHRGSGKVAVALGAALIAVILTPRGSAAAPSGRPNIILFISDDQGWPYNGFLGHPFTQTPRLDRLAAEGAVFEMAHVAASVCRPSAAAIATGRRCKDFVFEPGPGTKLHKGMTTIADVLKKEGYATYLAGKFPKSDVCADLPTYRNYGFDFDDGTGKGTNNRYLFARDRRVIERVREFIGTFDPHNDDPDDPGERAGQNFFLWAFAHSPHSPHKGEGVGLKTDDPDQDHPAQPDHAQKYRDQQHPHFSRAYEAWATVNDGEDKVQYHAMITWMDDLVGQLFDTLQEAELLDETVFIFLTDNGHHLHEAKGKFSESALRTPFLVWGPGNPGVTHRVFRQKAVSSLDILPTILDYAGVTPASWPPEFHEFIYQEGRDHPSNSFKSRSLRALLSEEEAVPEEGLAWRPYLVGHSCVEMGLGGRERDLLVYDYVDELETWQWYRYQLAADGTETVWVLETAREIFGIDALVDDAKCAGGPNSCCRAGPDCPCNEDDPVPCPAYCDTEQQCGEYEVRGYPVYMESADFTRLETKVQGGVLYPSSDKRAKWTEVLDSWWACGTNHACDTDCASGECTDRCTCRACGNAVTDSDVLEMPEECDGGSQCGNGDDCTLTGTCADGGPCQVRVTACCSAECATTCSTTITTTTTSITTTTLACGDTWALCSGPCDCGVCSLLGRQCVCVADGTVGCNVDLMASGGQCSDGACPPGHTCVAAWVTCLCQSD
jgi:arylsulfatase A-like enzyme